jgi:ribosomal protein L32
MKRFIEQKQNMQGENICKITGYKCYTQKICLKCEVYRNYKKEKSQ